MKIYSPYFSLFERNLKFPIDIILSEHQEPTNEQPDHNNFIQIWEAQIKETFKIAEKNTRKRKSANKKQRDLKATLKFRNCKQGPSENCNREGGPGKIRGPAKWRVRGSGELRFTTSYLESQGFLTVTPFNYPNYIENQILEC